MTHICVIRPQLRDSRWDYPLLYSEFMRARFCNIEKKHVGTYCGWPNEFLIVRQCLRVCSANTVWGLETYGPCNITQMYTSIWSDPNRRKPSAKWCVNFLYPINIHIHAEFRFILFFYLFASPKSHFRPPTASMCDVITNTLIRFNYQARTVINIPVVTVMQLWDGSCLGLGWQF